MFAEDYWTANAQGKIVAGARFPADKISQGNTVTEEKDMYGRVKVKDNG
jgi:hypothetical protein